MNTPRKSIFSAAASGILSIVAITACGQTQAVMDPTGIATSDEAMAATSTSTPEPTPTEAPTPTATRTVTPTPEAQIITIKQDAFCRVGPGTTFPISDFLAAGYEVNLAGITEVPRFDDTLEPELWYVLPRPSDGELCWVFHTVADVTGDLDGVAVITAPPTYTPEPNAGPPPIENALLYFLILKDTGGPVGCGDSLIAVNSGVARARTLEENIINVLNALFNLKTQFSDGLYNALYQSSLTAKRVDMDGTTAYVYTRGTVVKPKSDCDKERYRVQVWTTVENFSDVTRAIIYANNALLGDLLEQGGKK